MYIPTKEDEQAKLHVTKHCGEELCYNKSADHVDTNSDTLSCRSNLQRKNFTWYQPSKWTPRPSITRNIYTYDTNNYTC